MVRRLLYRYVLSVNTREKMLNNIKNIVLYTLITSFSLGIAQQKATGVGYGLTKDAAVEQAKRDAVEQGLGAYMT